MSKWLIFHQDKLIAHTSPVFALLSTDDILPFRQYLIREHLIGQLDGSDVYSAELTLSATGFEAYSKLSLRSALELMSNEWYALAAKAFSIINWDRNHQYCGRCGQPTILATRLFERACPKCQLNFYPRISPSIIVLIQKGDEILMARSSHFPAGVYGLIAGFVEPGESIEATVHREVYEETRLRIRHLKYFGSQPWPFPDSLMMGFFAEYESGELEIDRVELEHAGWYRYDQLPGRPSTHLSIASKMLDHYLEQHPH